MPKSFRKVPAHIRRSLAALPDRQIVAACMRTVSALDVQSGFIAHLDISLTKDGLAFPSAVIPPIARGRYSRRNQEGWEVVRRDLPKETQYNLVETPNWGDWANGTHTVRLPYKRYPRDFFAPTLAAIEIECPDESPGRSAYVLKFQVSEVLDRETADFEARLLASINLLQENVGACDVAPASATFAQYLQTLNVSWEILPPGTKEDVVARLFRGRAPSAEELHAAEDRYPFLMALDPQRLIYGTSGLQRYFGALLTPDLVVFENIRYGNAIYLMFEDWQLLSQRSRTELLSGRFGGNFERIVHKPNWQTRVKALIDERRGQVSS